ncbi:MAG: hypothetical protein NVS1B2_22190 [Vulcanimicrobiaceae bacterium]
MTNVGHGPAIDVRLRIDVQFASSNLQKWSNTVAQSVEGINLRAGDSIGFAIADLETDLLRLGVEPRAQLVLPQYSPEGSIAYGSFKSTTIYEDDRAQRLGAQTLSPAVYDETLKVPAAVVR